MALEKSVVDPHIIEKLLYDKYRLGVKDFSILHGGSANCYKIDSDRGTFVLKEFQSTYSVEDVQQEPKINTHLKNNGVSTAQFCKTIDGSYVWEFSNRVFHLQEYLEGIIYPQNTASHWLMRESALLLGKIHDALSTYPPLKEGIGIEWFTNWDVSTSYQEYKKLIYIAEQIESKLLREKVLNDLKYKINLLSKINHLRFDFEQLTKRNSHGDYSILQLLCQKDRITFVLDFSGACNQPVIWEVIRSYTYADPQCSNGKITIKNLKQYIVDYLRHGVLTAYDLKMMPYLYIFQLARSRYGYTEYLIKKSENKEALLNFAFWRTNMCRWLEEHAKLLSEELMTMAG